MESYATLAGGAPELQGDEEDVRDYGPGGYHPVQIGDAYKNGRYVVERKLGWGYFSTVWLAHDTHKEDTFVALKIVRAAPNYTETALDEVQLLKRVQREDESHPGRRYVVSLLDEFVHAGPNGRHVCMVFEVLGENLVSLMRRYHYKGLPSKLVKQITVQVMLALDYLHRKCGIIHTDLKPENVLIKITDIDAVMQELAEEDARNGRRRSVGHVTNSQPLPSPLHTPAKLRKGSVASVRSVASEPDEDDGLVDVDEAEEDDDQDEITALEDNKIVVKIADFGNACSVDHHYTEDIQTRQYRSPEVLLGCEWGAGVDCWSLACMVFELLTGDFLFEPQKGKTYSKDEDHLAQVMELLGPLPQPLFAGKHVPLYYDSRRRLRNITKLKVWPLPYVLIGKYGFGEHDVRKICDLLLPLLELDPHQRADCGSLLKKEWLLGQPHFDELQVDRPPGLPASSVIQGWAREEGGTGAVQEARHTPQRVS